MLRDMMVRLLLVGADVAVMVMESWVVAVAAAAVDPNKIFSRMAWLLAIMLKHQM